ncbi:MAG: tetratricopeptide repeat protein [Verrucomicrobiota bacterium]
MDETTNAGFYVELAQRLEAGGEWRKATAAYQKALNKTENAWPIHLALGNLFHRQADYASAIAEYERALTQQPDSPEILYNIANSQADAGNIDGAIQAHQRVLQIRPDFYPALKELGVLWQQQGKISQALEAYQKALKLQPHYAEGYASLGGLYGRQGFIQDAIDCYRRALEINPALHQAHSNLLFFINFDPAFDPQTVFTEYRAWNELHAKKFAAQKKYPNAPDPHRRLRLGFVSPDFREHVVGSYLEIFFRNFDKEKFEIYCYANVRRPDEATKKFQTLATVWREILNCSDEEASELIQQDQVDILIDLAGHMADNRLLVFARKPAPVQVTQFGYPNTTGLDAMDFRLTDFEMDPPGLTEKNHSEKLIRLPRCIFCYRPIEHAPEVSLLPFLKKGNVTFGSLNNFAKVSDGTIALWSRILKEIPQSTLLILIQGGADNIEAVKQRFDIFGIAPERLELCGLRSRKDFLKLHHEVDIALDPFPYNGGITTLDALWMGVPVVTLEGHTSCARHGVSILKSLGVPEWIASSEEDYFQIATQLARDTHGLQQTRATLRQRLQKSPLMDEKDYTRDLENAYREMWTIWHAT